MREDSKVAGIIVNRLTKSDWFVKGDIMPKSAAKILNGLIGDVQNQFAT